MSIAGRVVIRCVAVMAVVLVGVALLTFQLVKVAGRSNVDREARIEAAELTESLRDLLPEAAGLDGVLSAPETRGAASDALVLHPSGPNHVSVIHLPALRLRGQGGPAAIYSLVGGAEAPPTRPGSLRSVDTVVGPLRVLDQPVVDNSGQTIAIVSVYRGLGDVGADATAALLQALLAAAIGVIIGAGALTFVVRRSLQPLLAVAAATSTITSTDLAARVPSLGTNDEVAALADEVNRLLERIEAGDRSRRDDLAAISHELRNPLAVAEGHLELLERLGAETPEDTQRTVAIVHHELERLHRVLDDLIAVARGAGEIEIRDEAVFIPDLFADIERGLAGLDYGGNIIVEPAPPVVALADQTRVEQCLTNLIRNAIEHNRYGTSIRLLARDSADNVVVTVEDDGQGIGADILPTVFEPFTTTRPHGADRTTGLGLAVVRSLIEAQGGTVALQTRSTGTTATVTLLKAGTDSEMSP